MRHNRKAYTLMEIMIVITIAAGVAVLVLPSFTNQAKKVRSQEGVTALSGLYLAQKNYYEDTGAYASALTSLEVSIPTMQNFNTPTVYASSTIACNGGTAVQTLASAADVNAEYTLYVLVDGRIVCSPCTGICLKLGFSTW